MGLFSKQAPKLGLIETYSVGYLGGLADCPNGKKGFKNFSIYEDRFTLSPAFGSSSWFRELTIFYISVTDFQIVQRTVGTLEGVIGGLDSKQLNQANNIHISYYTDAGAELTLRLEMMSGITVMGQAKKCLDLLDRMKIHRISEQFPNAPTKQIMPTPSLNMPSIDIPGQIEKLASLRDKGILSEDEFHAKKLELLARM